MIKNDGGFLFAEIIFRANVANKLLRRSLSQTTSFVVCYVVDLILWRMRDIYLKKARHQMQF